jgi:DNA-binding MarR family transcriptional regulator
LAGTAGERMATVSRARARKGARNPRPASSGPYDAPPVVARSELLLNGSDRNFNLLLHNLSALRARLAELGDKNGASIGLAPLEHVVLTLLARVVPATDVGVQELADMLRLSGAFMTSTVNGLVDKGVVSKSPHPVDGRRICLRVTPRGLDLLANLAPLQRQVNDLAFGELSATEFRQLCDLVERLLDSVEQAGALQDFLLRSPSRRQGRKR